MTHFPPLDTTCTKPVTMLHPRRYFITWQQGSGEQLMVLKLKCRGEWNLSFGYINKKQYWSQSILHSTSFCNHMHKWDWTLSRTLVVCIVLTVPEQSQVLVVIMPHLHTAGLSESISTNLCVYSPRLVLYRLYLIHANRLAILKLLCFCTLSF